MIEADARTLADRILLDFPSPRGLADPVWRFTPAAKVIDCVLSLRKKYKLIVEPRVKRFVNSHPSVIRCPDLRTLIDSWQSPESFMAEVLHMRSPSKATMLVGVLDYLIDIQDRFEGEHEEERLAAWARWARPGDCLTLDVHGFKLAGFQYLRMLFGADTVKPDVHILAYVEEALSRPIAGRMAREVQAIFALERASELIGQPVRHIDVAIWERRSGQRLGP